MGPDFVLLESWLLGDQDLEGLQRKLAPAEADVATAVDHLAGVEHVVLAGDAVIAATASTAILSMVERSW